MSHPIGQLAENRSLWLPASASDGAAAYLSDGQFSILLPLDLLPRHAARRLVAVTIGHGLRRHDEGPRPARRTLQCAGAWDQAGRILADAARAVESAGAQALVLCTNTMHKVSGAIEAAVRIPLLHIADATAARIRGAGLRQVGLLATRFTMEQSFYRDRLRERHGIEVLAIDSA